MFMVVGGLNRTLLDALEKILEKMVAEKAEKEKLLQREAEEAERLRTELEDMKRMLEESKELRDREHAAAERAREAAAEELRKQEAASEARLLEANGRLGQLRRELEEEKAGARAAAEARRGDATAQTEYFCAELAKVQREAAAIAKDECAAAIAAAKTRARDAVAQVEALRRYVEANRKTNNAQQQRIGALEEALAHAKIDKQLNANARRRLKWRLHTVSSSAQLNANARRRLKWRLHTVSSSAQLNANARRPR
eukprot:TRINITY_DN2222_c0_g2_i8.p2 TRINITY_DN2222_c0_g2~~TRINITY_DN2222_c0_g2_i8.p2  ORF type:complete len:255 (+),score=96.37 TRINITY_DN2222_c0_g2_i8:863-1627(+)